ncbi:MAG: hypothetical protein RIB58_04445 [Phycisphaerales bacterium]
MPIALIADILSGERSDTMADARSPNYPAFSLKEAAEKAADLYQKIKHSTVRMPTVRTELGYSEKSSSGMQAVGALVAYGLLDSIGRGVDRKAKLSKIGLAIIHQPDGSPERQSALRDAALRPKAHAALWAEYGDDLPPSDEAVVGTLIAEHGYIDSAARQLIAQYRETIAFAGLDSADEDVRIEDDGDEDGPPAVKAGDWVQWTSNGVAQFPEGPRKVLGVSEDETFAFVAGTKTGVPMSELAIENPQTGTIEKPANPFLGEAGDKDCNAVPISIKTRPGSVQVLRIPKMTKTAFDFFKKQIELFEDEIVES